MNPNIKIYGLFCLIIILSIDKINGRSYLQKLIGPGRPRRNLTMLENSGPGLSQVNTGPMLGYKITGPWGAVGNTGPGIGDDTAAKQPLAGALKKKDEPTHPKGEVHSDVAVLAEPNDANDNLAIGDADDNLASGDSDGVPAALYVPDDAETENPFPWLPMRYLQQPESPYSKTFTVDWQYGIVTYYVDPNFYDDDLKQRIQDAMNQVESSSCVRFKEEKVKPTLSPDPWLHFTNPNRQKECAHDTPKGVNNDILIVLGIECLKTQNVLHSVLHGIGFKDEVTHPHRDQYIRILWENIQPSYRPLFRIHPDKAPYKLVEYDPLSVMHFHDRAYSENGGLTITPVIPGIEIKPSDRLSQLDVMKLRIMYGQECNKRKVGDIIENCKNALSDRKKLSDPANYDDSQSQTNSVDDEETATKIPDNNNSEDYVTKSQPESDNELQNPKAGDDISGNLPTKPIQAEQSDDHDNSDDYPVKGPSQVANSTQNEGELQASKEADVNVTIKNAIRKARIDKHPLKLVRRTKKNDVSLKFIDGIA